jgi:surface antigen
MKGKLMSGIVACSMVVVGGCLGTGTKQETGAAAGAILGAALGYGLGKDHQNKELAIILGGMAGAMVGSSIGAKLDERDRLLANQNLQHSLEFTPDGTTSSWKNPNTGHNGIAVPTKTYTAGSGQPCRNFDVTFNVESETERQSGTACRQPDGTWAIQS